MLFSLVVLFFFFFVVVFFFFFKQKTAYEMRISDWSSDVCSSDLHSARGHDVGDARTALGECSGFVEGESMERSKGLERTATLDQHAAARCAGNARQYRTRCGDCERAWAGRHEDGHRPIEAVAEWLIDNHPGKQQDHHQREDGGHARSEEHTTEL